MEKLKDASWYDAFFEKSPEYHLPFNLSGYYPVWLHVVRMMMRGDKVLDLGCGPGQFAQICVQSGLHYIGVDFSSVALEMARSIVPFGAQFIQADLDKLEPLQIDFNQIDVVTCIETLEHVEHDREILDDYARDKEIIITLPTFDWEGHVRFFKTAQEIVDRYPAFGFVRIEKVGRIFVCRGFRRTRLWMTHQ